VTEIATASGQQSSDIEAINKSLTRMDHVTRKNSALVEQNAATSRLLDEQAKAMADRVAFFRLAADKSAAPAIHAAMRDHGKRVVAQILAARVIRYGMRMVLSS
jgi:hypothetical protein